MKIKSLLGALTHICLLGGSIIFVKETINEYKQGSTFYSVTQETITEQDLPTFTICWLITPYNPRKAYGKDLLIEVKFCEHDLETATLLENRNVETSGGLEIHLTEL